MASTVVWQPQRLTAAIANANRASYEATLEDARLRRRNKSKSDVRLVVSPDGRGASLVAVGLQGLFEVGRKARYTEVAANSGVRAIAVSSGPLAGRAFASVSPGPMAPAPAMNPAADDWARTGYRNVSTRALAVQGFAPRIA